MEHIRVNKARCRWCGAEVETDWAIRPVGVVQDCTYCGPHKFRQICSCGDFFPCTSKMEAAMAANNLRVTQGANALLGKIVPGGTGNIVTSPYELAEFFRQHGLAGKHGGVVRVHDIPMYVMASAGRHLLRYQPAR